MQRSLPRLVIENTQKQETQIFLTSEQQHYLYRVLRLQEGDRFVAIDGQGKSYVVNLVDKIAQILEELKESRELSVSVTLMAALPKGNGFDEVVRCCTELGVATIMPVISDRTLLKPSPHKLERWRKIAQEATEQSERQIVPTILQPNDFKTAITLMTDAEADCYICVARTQTNHLLKSLQNRSPKKIIIATGPEGGWTPAEIENAIYSGFMAVSLGSRILRAITAPIVALSLITATIEQIK